ncbi:MAG: 2-amino-4-hydroxy-6-hydroxymethyldihydropteridine diphosphokinase [Candidatus Polarisedimenticolaceae bacterium]|nr:2-amino-4-hydroxy-6-hydroxymethyldihydropteridine diphosphokinase [Candidatus Polarisedimenticolaceae bacterium]
MSDHNMPNAWLSLGSNIDREQHIRAAIRLLGTQFGALVISPVYESRAVGFEGEDFFNLVVGIQTNMSISALISQLHAIEVKQGRQRSSTKFAPRTLDIDLLTYGTQVIKEGVKLPREEITRYAFVLKPLADVAGSEIHPPTQQSYQQLWNAFNANDQPLWLATLQFDGLQKK